MLNFLLEVHTGVKGLVVDESQEPVANAMVQWDNLKAVNTTRQGEFWKLLMPGNYTVVGGAGDLEIILLTICLDQAVTAAGYQLLTRDIVVLKSQIYTQAQVVYFTAYTQTGTGHQDNLQEWKKSPYAYKGITHPNHPNFFILLGS